MLVSVLIRIWVLPPNCFGAGGFLTCLGLPRHLDRYYSHSLPEEWQLNVFAHIDTNKDVQLSFLETRAYFVKLQSAGTTPDLKAIDPDAEAQRVCVLAYSVVLQCCRSYRDVVAISSPLK